MNTMTAPAPAASAQAETTRHALIDVALALMGRMQQQLQLLSLAFPVKMLAALGVLVALAPLIPKLFSAAAERTLSTLLRVVHGG